MIRYLLDTDIVSLLARGEPRVVRAVEARRPEELGLTVISVEELLAGWYTMLRRVNSPEAEADVYLRITRTVTFLARLPIVTYAAPAIVRFRQLAATRLNIGGHDLRIAAIALESGCAVVTRNERDFRRVPGLAVENWAS